ncbi:uncharacterized protein KY384_004832 [Bacidia gigantensis]|uniref:uncharacterized protein n=1 Tax=Bacidia gigantensis TaxID=2732470 RepID=UPI001D04B3EB|nr:uncharacterized protein KY384_004832 [Bacidia gigantensis]KAG8530330.1 hypothetical protein KY384_004832 [Bacidia gigantensis]
MANPTVAAIALHNATLGNPRPLLPRYAIYDTMKYPRYDPHLNNVGTTVLHFSTAKDYSVFREYSLFMNAQLTAMNRQDALLSVPSSGVRLDDLTLAFVINNRDRNRLKTYIADFDLKGMIRATRLPLGQAAKREYPAGTPDMNGHVLTQQEAGWYYLRYKGLQCLMGKEGADAGRYLVRPSHEWEYPGTWYFQVADRAVVQLAPGDPNDPTPGL